MTQLLFIRLGLAQLLLKVIEVDTELLEPSLNIVSSLTLVLEFTTMLDTKLIHFYLRWTITCAT